MGTVLFSVALLAMIGQVVEPLRSKSRSAAVYGCLTMWLVGVAAVCLREDNFSAWQKARLSRKHDAGHHQLGFSPRWRLDFLAQAAKRVADEMMPLKIACRRVE